ncbi:MAG: hypothetical protein R2681_03280 [Pyrinomonadaceae bacterium]
MKLPQRSLILIVFLFLLFTGSCVSPENASIDDNSLRPNVNTNFNSDAANANANTAKDDEIELDKLINLPFEPEENIWRKADIQPNGNSNMEPERDGEKLTVVLKFSDEKRDAVINRIKSNRAPSQTTFEPESWFPAELVAKSETSGDNALKGTSYGPEGFAKAPYLIGSMIHIADTNYFVLDLRTK